MNTSLKSLKYYSLAFNNLNENGPPSRDYYDFINSVSANNLNKSISFNLVLCVTHFTINFNGIDMFYLFAII